jgi:hypothetical protein
LSAGVGITYNSSTGVISNSIGYGFSGSGTSTTLTFSGGLLSIGSTTINGNATTTGTFFASIASSSQLYGAGLRTCNSGNVLTWSGGLFGCVADQTSTGQANAFSFADNYGSVAAATSSALWAQNGIFASSTSHFVNADFTNATTSNLGIGTLTGLLQAQNGVVSSIATSSLGFLSSTSIQGAYPVQYNSSTGIFSLAFGTTTSNTWSGTQTYGTIIATNASTTNATTTSLYVGTITGPLQAINGRVSATSTLSIIYGGTGTSTLPTYGQILVGNNAGGFDYLATSSLGITATGGGSTAFGKSWEIVNGYLAPTTTIGILVNASSTIGGGTPISGLTVSGDATTTGLLHVLGSGTSTILTNIAMTGNIVPTGTNTYTLGDFTHTWKEVFIGPGSLYVNGQKVISTDGSNNVVVSSDPNQNLEVKTTGTADVILNPSGSGQVQIKAGINLTAGKNFTTSDSSAVLVPFGVAAGNITVSGNAITATNLNGGISLTPAGSGGTYVTTGNFGIGSTTPATTLSVSGSGFITGGLGIGLVNNTTGTLQTSATTTIGAGLFVTGTTTLNTSLNGVLQATNGVVSTISTSTLGLLSSSSISATYPIQYTAATGVFSLAFGTTTANTWSQVQTFTNGIALSNITSCAGGQALQTNVSGVVSCGTISTGGSSTGGGWTTDNIGDITLATSTDRVGIGATSTPYAKLSILSGNAATTTLALLPASGQTANILDIYNTSGALSTVFTAQGSLGLGTTSPARTLAVQGNFYTSGTGFFGGAVVGTSTLAITGSTTIAGQFNAVGGATFGTITAGATTLSSLTLGSLNGPLQANSGIISATSSIGVLYGGTGLTTAPSYGNLLVGNSSGGYTLTATSSLGLLSINVDPSNRTAFV